MLNFINKLRTKLVLSNCKILSFCHSNYNCNFSTKYLPIYPYKSLVYRIKYEKYDWIVSILLFILLISISLVFGNLGSLLNYRSLHPTNNMCNNKYHKLYNIRNLVNNITKYDDVIYNVTAAKNLTLELYLRANITYPGWPNPYKMSDKDIDDLTRRSKLQCSKRVCVGVSFNIGFNCKRVTFPCPDIDASNKLDEYKMWQEIYDINNNTNSSFCNSITFNNTNNICNISYTSNSTYLGNNLIYILDDMLNRITLANSIYVVYSAFTIFFGSAVVITKIPISNAISTTVIRKYWWIIAILLIWYLIDLLLMLTKDYAFSGLSNAELGNISLYIYAIWYEPCWLDSGFSSDVYSYIRKTCIDLSTWENRFSAISNQYDHDRLVAGSYSIDGLDQIYPNNTFVLDNTCDERLLITAMYQDSIYDNDMIEVVDIFTRLGHLLILFLQAVIAHWIISVFSVCKPLSAQSGKVIVPIDYLVDVMYRDDNIRSEFDENIKRYYRKRSFIGFMLYTLLLILSVCYIIITNL